MSVSTYSEYQSYSPTKAVSSSYRTKSTAKYADHRDAVYNTTISPYKTPNRDSRLRVSDDRLDLSDSKIRLDSQVRDIKAVLDAKFLTESELWKSRWSESESRRSALETENSILAREIEFWRSKSSGVSELERTSLLLSESSRLASSFPSSTTSSDILLRLEADKLRDILTSKISECNEIKSSYSKLELADAESRGKDEVAQSYESRIIRLKTEYAEKIRECEELRRQKIKHELDSYELTKAQREADALKSLLEAKREENSQIRREKTDIEVENYKSKKVETELLEKEAELKSQIELLESRAVETESLRKSQYLEKSKVLSEEQENLRKSVHFEQKEIEEEVEKEVALAHAKQNELEELRRNYNSLNSELLSIENKATLAEIQLAEWKVKATQAEQLKELEVARAARLKEAEIQLTLDEFNKEKRLLEDRAQLLNEVVVSKENGLNQLEEEVAATQLEKTQLDEERSALQGQVDDLLKKQQENDLRFQSQLKTRDHVQSASLERHRKEHENEARRIGNQISALRVVISNKSEEAERARREASDFSIRLISCERKAAAAEAESSYWRNVTDRVNRERTLECQIEKSLTSAQLRDLEHAQSIEKLQQLREAENLRLLLSLREKEAIEAQTSKLLTASQVSKERSDIVRLQLEADLNRSRAIESDRARLSEIRLKSSIHIDAIDSLRRSAIIEASTLRSEREILADSLLRQEIEARSWRDSYARLSSTPRKY